MGTSPSKSTCKRVVGISPQSSHSIDCAIESDRQNAKMKHKSLFAKITGAADIENERSRKIKVQGERPFKFSET